MVRGQHRLLIMLTVRLCTKNLPLMDTLHDVLPDEEISNDYNDPDWEINYRGAYPDVFNNSST